METKIKINITNATYDILIKDMELFEFYKDDYTLNKNHFYNTLILNYYEIFREKENHLLKYLKSTINAYTDLNQDDLARLSFEISDHINKLNHSTEHAKYSVNIAIKPTKLSQKAFDYIQEYLLINQSISNYFRTLFSSYASLPQNQREKIIFKTQYETILNAIKNKKKIFFTTIKGGHKRHESSPYAICNSKEELFNYLLALHKNKPYTYRLSRIQDVTILKDDAVIQEEQKAIFEKMILFGPQYSYGNDEVDEVVVRLSNRGIQQYRSMYIHRPIPTKIEENLYYFNCSYTQILQYFARFGRSAYIISPIALTNQLEEFYRKSYILYRKNSGRKPYVDYFSEEIGDNEEIT